jgi:GTP cyclohydrolase I
MEIKFTNSQIDRDKMIELIKQQLHFIGENPDREGLKETPQRILKSWDELYAGYNMNAIQILKTFQEGVCDELVLLKDIEFFSTCEHHMLPFFGSAHIGYIPNKKVIGVSKLARLVELFSRRLQIQERMTTQIADFLDTHLKCKGCMVVVEAQHFCMTSRGVKKQHSKMVTSAVRGLYKDDINARQEFLNLIR